MAVHAEDVLAGAAHTDDLAAAVADARFLVGTTHRPPAGMQVLTPRELAAAAATRGAPTLLFGGEQRGLDPGELLRCHAAATIPVAPEQTSLNLAQAVCVFAAELFVAHGADRRQVLPAAAPAPAALLQRLEQAFTTLLAATAWRDASREKHAVAALLQPLWRAGLTEAEVRDWLVALGKVAQAPRR